MQHFCKPNSAIVAYEDDSVSEHAVAALLLKKLKPKGKLPVTPPCIDVKHLADMLPIVAAEADSNRYIATHGGGAVYIGGAREDHMGELKPVLLPRDAGVSDAICTG